MPKTGGYKTSQSLGFLRGHGKAKSRISAVRTGVRAYMDATPLYIVIIHTVIPLRVSITSGRQPFRLRVGAKYDIFAVFFFFYRLDQSITKVPALV